MSNLSLSSVNLEVTQPPVISSVPSFMVPNAAVTDQRSVTVNPPVSMSVVDTTAFVAAPSMAIAPPPLVAALPSTGTISVLPSVAMVTPASSVITSIAPASIASSLPVGTSVSSPSASSSQPSYQPLVVVNTPPPVGASV